MIRTSLRRLIRKSSCLPDCDDEESPVPAKGAKGKGGGKGKPAVIGGADKGMYLLIYTWIYMDLCIYICIHSNMLYVYKYYIDKGRQSVITFGPGASESHPWTLRKDTGVNSR
jgi:hypothetical protein